MGAYAIALIWGVFILCAMVGWGFLVSHGVLRLQSVNDWSRMAAAGFAFGACIGGAFDLLGLISKWLIIAFLTLGGIAFVYRLVRFAKPAHATARPKFHSWLLTVPVLAVAGTLLIVRVAGAVIVLQPSVGMQLGSFNTFDDFQAYIVYPLKMLETGSMGADPFSVRRTATHALGGNTFLQTFVLAALPVQSLKLLDAGLGTMLVIGLLWSYMARMGLTTFTAASVILVFLAIPPPIVNITAVLIPVAFFISLFLILEDGAFDAPRVSRAAVIGLHAAAICVLKTNLMPAALAFIGVRWLLLVLRSFSKREAVIEGILWHIATAVAILPWVLDSYRWTGAFRPDSLAAYYADPSLVAGFQAARGWRFLTGNLKLLAALPYAYLAMLTGLLLTSHARVSDAFWSLLAAVAVGSIAIMVAIGDVYRYTYPFVMSALLLALIQAIAVFAGSGVAVRTKQLALLGVSLATLVLVLSTIQQTRNLFKYNLSTAYRALRGEQLIAPALAAKYQSLQRALPEKAVLLEHMDYPFLFDFHRNTILLDDHPGFASLAPGQPFFAGGEALDSYLVSNGIRYVAYDYATETGLHQEGVLAALINDDLHPAAQSTVRLVFDFHKNLRQLGRTRERIFDDGTAFAVDLLSPH